MSAPRRHWIQECVEALDSFLPSSDDEPTSPLPRPRCRPVSSIRNSTSPPQSSRASALSGLSPNTPSSHGWQPSPDAVAWVHRVTMGGQRLHIRRQQDLASGLHDIGGRPRVHHPRGRNTLASASFDPVAPDALSLRHLPSYFRGAPPSRGRSAPPAVGAPPAAPAAFSTPPDSSAPAPAPRPRPGASALGGSPADSPAGRPVGRGPRRRGPLPPSRLAVPAGRTL